MSAEDIWPSVCFDALVTVINTVDSGSCQPIFETLSTIRGTLMFWAFSGPMEVVKGFSVDLLRGKMTDVSFWNIKHTVMMND